MNSLPRFALPLISLTLLLAPQLRAQQGAPPDPQMKAVLDELASLGGKPIADLSPEEGEKLAELLGQAGVKVNLKTYEGVTHEFFGMGAVVDKAKDAEQAAAADLKAAFGN